jgi:uncharacterized protein YndB with AHSA1/START domain
MMADITNEFTIQAAPHRVWNALTTSEEIARWWTDDLSATPEVGTLLELRFRLGTFIFEVADLEPDNKVYWVTRQGPSTGHWAGTSVTWHLEPTSDGTRVTFNHNGFAQADRRYEITRAWWEQYHASLKACLETGKGHPNSPPASFPQQVQDAN